MIALFTYDNMNYGHSTLSIEKLSNSIEMLLITQKKFGVTHYLEAEINTSGKFHPKSQTNKHGKNRQLYTFFLHKEKIKNKTWCFGKATKISFNPLCIFDRTNIYLIPAV